MTVRNSQDAPPAGTPARPGRVPALGCLRHVTRLRSRWLERASWLATGTQRCCVRFTTVDVAAARDLGRYLSDAKLWVENDRAREPLAGSDLAEDATAMEPYPGWHLAVSSRLVAIQYLDTLRAVVENVGELHLHPPVALLRGALEASGLACWLVVPSDAKERRRRGLHTWHADYDARAQYEVAAGWYPPNAQAKTARQRQQEIRSVAERCKILPNSVTTRLGTTKMLPAVAGEIGADAAEVSRLWALSSGVTHGRFWPNILGEFQTRGGTVLSDGTIHVALAVPDELLVGLAAAAHRFTLAARHWFAVRSAHAVTA